MTGNAKPIPDGYHTATAYLIVDDAAAAIEFYRRAFGASEIMRFAHGDKIGHAEIRIGDSPIMLADEYPDMGARSPKSLGGCPVSIMLYVDDVDDFVARAVAAGATLQQPVEDKFYGDRSGSLEDPFGHVWHISTHQEDMTIEEMHKRAPAEFQGAS
jgi:PhnB protein